MAAKQGIYKRSYDFTVVRRIRLTTTEGIEPGQAIDKSKFRQFQLKNWWRRRRIGQTGSAWVAAMLADPGNAHARPEVTGGVQPAVPENIAELANIKGDPAAFVLCVVGKVLKGDVREWNALHEQDRAGHIERYVRRAIAERVKAYLSDMKRADGVVYVPSAKKSFKTQRAAEAFAASQVSTVFDISKMTSEEGAPDAQAWSERT